MWHMSKPVKKVLRSSNFGVILETCPNLWWRSCSKCYAIDCFGTYFKHVQTCDDVLFQSAMQSTDSVHSWNMSKPVMTFFSKCYAIDWFGTFLKHVQTCDDARVQSAMQSTASVHSWNMSKCVVMFVFKVLPNRLLRYIRTRRRRRRRRRRKAREEDRMFKIWVLGRVCSATL